MNHVQIDKKKIEKKWAPIIESLGVGTDNYKKSWMAEYAEYHQLNENIAYANNANITGMGAVVSPTAGTIPGAAYTGDGKSGSGDLGQQLLAASMKVAAQTIGLDLVPVKPTPGPVIDLFYVDYRYDDITLGTDEKPQMFRVRFGTADMAIAKTFLNALIADSAAVLSQGGLNKRIFVTLTGALLPDALIEPTTKTALLEFLGYSRIDGLPMFRSYRQNNTASAGVFTFAPGSNTFGDLQTVAAGISLGFAAPTAVGGGATTAVATGAFASVTIELISAMEDHIPGYVSNWNKSYPMSRQEDDMNYPGIIAPDVSTKRVTVGTIEISSALKRTEMEDIKSQTGIDIVQKLESVLVNELSQTISRQIVEKIFQMGELNRASVPTLIGGSPIFDLDTSYVTGGPQGETTHAIQRKLCSKIFAASNYIASEGRIGPATYLVTNGRIAAALSDAAAYTINPVKGNMNTNGQLYPVGQIAGIQVYVDPYMKYDDNRVVLGRRNEVDQPGIVFVPYLMAQSISLISEATRAPRLFLRSRYAVVEGGFFPQKQYLTIKITDIASYLV
jgi:hypothetical protein